MSVSEYKDRFGRRILFDDAVRERVLNKHPEVVDFIDRLERVFSDPDEIRRSSRDSRSMLYYRFEEDVLKGKWVVAVVKDVGQLYVSTLYATDQIKSGELLWKKKTS